MVYDMTKGSSLKAIVSMTIPLMIGNVFQQFYGMADTFIVGHFLGQNALGAVGSTASIYSFIWWFTLGITGGFAVLLAQDFGAGNYKRLRERLCLSITLAGIITLITTIVSVSLVGKLLIWMNTPAELYDSAYQYIVVILSGLFSTTAYSMSAAVLRAIGDSKTPLYFLIISSVLNIILDIVFIRYLNLGTAGAAGATVISQAVSGILCIIYIYRKFEILHLSKDDWKIRKGEPATLLKIGLPLGINGCITASGIMILQIAVNGYGAEVVSAFATASKVEQLANQIVAAFSITMINFAGQNMGAKNYSNLKKGVKDGFFLMLFTAIILSTVLILFGGKLAGLFIDNPTANVIAYASQYLKISGTFFVFLGGIYVFRSVAQGMGDSKIPIINGIVESGSRIIWAVYLINWGSFKQLCFAGPTTWLVAAIITFILCQRKLKKLV